MDLHEELFGNVKPERLTTELFGVDTKPSDFATATALFESRGWETRLAGFGILTSPLYRQGYYWVTEKKGGKTIIHQEGLDRLEALDGIGIEYQQMIIAHQVLKPKPSTAVHVDWVEVGERVKNTTITTGKIVGTVLGGLAVGLGTLLISSVTMIDPRLCVVLNDPDNPWFEVFKWFD